ncbi:hypothetical protein J6590_051177 [Homalodisca vitripennis]|nr:hypothetical protein J6590_051177 [Homalodisca vitripennis]
MNRPTSHFAGSDCTTVDGIGNFLAGSRSKISRVLSAYDIETHPCKAIHYTLRDKLANNFFDTKRNITWPRTRNSRRHNNPRSMRAPR